MTITSQSVSDGLHLTINVLVGSIVVLFVVFLCSKSFQEDGSVLSLNDYHSSVCFRWLVPDYQCLGWAIVFLFVVFLCSKSFQEDGSVLSLNDYHSSVCLRWLAPDYQCIGWAIVVLFVVFLCSKSFQGRSSV